MDPEPRSFPLRFTVDPAEELNRASTMFRIILIIPIAIIAGLLTATGNETIIAATGEATTRSTGGIYGGLAVATALMILFRHKYPRWWFDFHLNLLRFTSRVSAYLLLLTDAYPSTDEDQAVHLDIDYPDVETDLRPGMVLVKWFLAIPHYIVLAVFWAVGVLGVIVAWFAIIFTGRYPRAIFNYVVGLIRWSLRVHAYAAMLITDQYPPFTLE